MSELKIKKIKTGPNKPPTTNSSGTWPAGWSEVSVAGAERGGEGGRLGQREAEDRLYKALCHEKSLDSSQIVVKFVNHCLSCERSSISVWTYTTFARLYILYVLKNDTMSAHVNHYTGKWDRASPNHP